MDEDDKNQAPRIPEISPEIRKYLQSLLIEGGSDILPGDIQADILYDLYVRFIDYLMANVAKALPEEKYYEFQEMLETEVSQAKIEEYIKANIDYSRVMRETFDEFRKIYLGK